MRTREKQLPPIVFQLVCVERGWYLSWSLSASLSADAVPRWLCSCSIWVAMASRLLWSWSLATAAASVSVAWDAVSCCRWRDRRTPVKGNAHNHCGSAH